MVLGTERELQLKSVEMKKRRRNLSVVKTTNAPVSAGEKEYADHEREEYERAV
jgi:hypothetical protein